jgi:glycosidase
VAKRALYQKLCQLRKTEPSLSEGKVLWLDNDQPDAVVSFARIIGAARLVTVVNLSNRALKVQVARPAGAAPVFQMLLADGATNNATSDKLTFDLTSFGYYMAKQTQ